MAKNLDFKPFLNLNTLKTVEKSNFQTILTQKCPKNVIFGPKYTKTRPKTQIQAHFSPQNPQKPSKIVAGKYIHILTGMGWGEGNLHVFLKELRVKKKKGSKSSENDQKKKEKK